VPKVPTGVGVDSSRAPDVGEEGRRGKWLGTSGPWSLSQNVRGGGSELLVKCSNFCPEAQADLTEGSSGVVEIICGKHII
jgi:hypothetical protein